MAKKDDNKNQKDNYQRYVEWLEEDGTTESVNQLNTEADENQVFERTFWEGKNFNILKIGKN